MEWRPAAMDDNVGAFGSFAPLPRRKVRLVTAKWGKRSTIVTMTALPTA